MPPNLPGGKPGSGPPFGRKIQKRIDMGETAWGAARRNRTEGRSSVSTEQREPRSNPGAVSPAPRQRAAAAAPGVDLGAAAVRLLIQRVKGERSW